MEGIANGVCATSGYSFPRIRGGTLLRRAVGSTAGASAEVVGAAGADEGTIKTFGWVTHGANTTYTYRLTAMSGGGVENVTDARSATLVFDGSAAWSGALPNPVSDLRARPSANGTFVARWTYNREAEQSEPATFRVYHDSGTGTIDYGSPVATVAYVRGQFHYRYASGSFADGTRVKWAVRARSSAGVEEANDVVALGVADATAPPINPMVVTRCG